MRENKVQTGLRISEGRYNELKKMADNAGASINSIILCLIEIGISVVNLGINQEFHALLHIQKGNDE